VRGLGLEPGGTVDFWTEAALFAEAGLTSIVFGPGHIAQAHTANEWIALDQLDRAAQTYTRLFSGTAGGH
jgi:acetylornithine deacetylase